MGRAYSTHFRFEATKDGLERFLKKIYSRQTADNLLPFPPVYRKWEIFTVQSKWNIRPSDVTKRNIKNTGGYSAQLSVHSVHVILDCRITSIFHMLTTLCLRLQHRFHDTKFHMSGTRSSRPFAQSVLKPQNPHGVFSSMSSWTPGEIPFKLEARRCFFLEMNFALPSFSNLSFLLAIVCLKYESEVACLVSYLFRHFVSEL